ncbi:hypothetical protein HPX95_02740 [Bacillus tequilensis]|uniref:hypothetical protein n=1 Tax=Bacillus tequilensis TaxID=227866 RepID=UPI001576DDD7|nr:hypothetical protein [Bacillus tequilensis]NTU25110.1 hypothetical protein [Bacillus tequilensis]
MTSYPYYGITPESAVYPILENERIAGIVALGDLSVKKDTDQKNGEALSEISNQHNKR